MIINRCSNCNRFFYEDGYVSISPYQEKLLTECERVKIEECSECADRRMLVERLNLAASSCGACCEL